MNRAPEVKPEQGVRLVLSRARGFMDSLAGRLLLLTAIAVLAGELMIFVPALAAYHDAWLRERINLAQTAALAAAAAPEDSDITDQLQLQLLENAGVRRIAMKRGGERELILDEGGVTGPLTLRDYLNASAPQRFWWAFDSFFAPNGRTLRVLAKPRFESGEFIEIVLSEEPLKRAMGDWALEFLIISTLILAAAAGLVYATLTFAFVRPILQLTSAIERFRDHPEDASIAFVRSARADEIGRAERAAADMADQIRTSLRQRERLAALGAAVARIGHDLRNMLSTAQLVSERLANSEDPTVRQVAPRLERSIGRAAALASSTLKFGRADEAEPNLTKVNLLEAVTSAAEDALAPFAELSFALDIEPAIAAKADADHVHRLLVNLLRNAARAMDGANRDGHGLSVHAVRAAGYCYITIEDHGPGVPEKLKPHLFEPFVTSDRSGTGLGLAISRELARAMGGDLVLLRSDATGAAFQVTLRAI